jgi:hypothetical protein
MFSVPFPVPWGLAAARLQTGRDVDRLTFGKRHDTPFFTSLCALDAAEALHLALAHQRVDSLTLTPNSASTAALISGLEASRATLKMTWF